MQIIATIIPIFAVIALGGLARRKGFMPTDFLAPANRLVYYLAIPAMLFRSLSKASLKTHANITSLTLTLISMLIVFGFAWGIGILARVKKDQLGSFMQSAIHSNLGYIGLAVAYYTLGNEGLIRAGILAGFMIILQNLLGVLAHQFYSRDTQTTHGPWPLLKKILGNPVIFSAMAGIIFSLSGRPLPLVVDRSLKILGDLALPMALLVIGASLSFDMIRVRLRRVLSASFMKLILLPGLAWVLFRSFEVPVADYVPGLILLSSPTATVTYVMAREMHGDPEFAVAAVSASTMISVMTISAWLIFAGIPA